MQTLSKSVLIKAPKETVWDTMLDKDSYSEWTKPFNETSRYEGDWSEGSKIIFLGTDENGNNEGGMVSRIAKNIPYEFLSIEHLGIVEHGVEDTASEKAKSWAPSFENYTFTEENGITEVIVQQDLDEQHIEMFEAMWKKAFAKLKELAESKS